MASIGERIGLARRLAGMSMRELASKAGVSAQAISKYESGADIPSSGVLLRLAQSLGVKIEFFFRVAKVSLAAPQFRKKSALPKKSEAAVLAAVQEWLERYLEVESLIALDAPERFKPPEHLECRVFNLQDCERLAEQLRDAWGLGHDPIDNLIETLEEQRLKVHLLPAHEGFDGLCTTLTANNDPVIVVQRDVPGDRQRMSLAHELGHVLAQLGPGVDEEQAARRFAGAFLVPRAAAHMELGNRRTSLSIPELHLLKHKYGMSMQGWVLRAKDLGIIDESLAVRYVKLFRVRGWSQLEPGDALPSESPQRMSRIVWRLIADRAISESRASELLGKPFSEFCRRFAEKHAFPPEICRGH